MTKIAELTVEHLGPDATEADLEQFKGWAIQLCHLQGISEEEAVEKLWRDGDYRANAYGYGFD